MKNVYNRGETSTRHTLSLFAMERFGIIEIHNSKFQMIDLNKIQSWEKSGSNPQWISKVKRDFAGTLIASLPLQKQ